MPYIFNFNGASGFTNLPSLERLIGRYDQMLRSVWLDRNFEHSGYPAMSLPPTVDQPDGIQRFAAPDRAAFLTDLKTIARNFSGVGGTYVEVDKSLFPSGDKPQEGLDGADAGKPAGILIGAISQNNQMFYFWTDHPSFGVEFGMSIKL